MTARRRPTLRRRLMFAVAANVLTMTPVVCVLALPAFLEERDREAYEARAVEYGTDKALNQPTWSTALADAWPRCDARPRTIGQDVLAVTNDGETRRMSADRADAIRDGGGSVWVVGYCR
ncbi:hypothetical protein [Nocardioides nanhaiensis]|uniref:DUF4258 domain-containing protein n=1 Tax=Nocardioides nanhaiensis TaxID=1476871 RepID=A0ABP8W562_9ACTN